MSVQPHTFNWNFHFQSSIRLPPTPGVLQTRSSSPVLSQKGFHAPTTDQLGPALTIRYPNLPLLRPSGAGSRRRRSSRRHHRRFERESTDDRKYGREWECIPPAVAEDVMLASIILTRARGRSLADRLP